MTSINCSCTLPADQPQAAQGMSVRKARRLRRWQSQSELKRPFQQKEEQNLSLSALQYQIMPFLSLFHYRNGPCPWAAVYSTTAEEPWASFNEDGGRIGEERRRNFSLVLGEKGCKSKSGKSPEPSLCSWKGKQGSLWWWCNASVLTSMGWRRPWPNEVQLAQLQIQGTTAWGSRAGWEHVLAGDLGATSDFTVQQPIDWAGKFPSNDQINSQNHRN